MVIKVAPWAAFTRMWQDRQSFPAASQTQTVARPTDVGEQELTGGAVAQP
jgi:hypothetical protein